MSAIPELRFPEFEGKWEIQRGAKIGKFTKGAGVSKADLSENGNIPAIRYGELYTRYGANITNVFSRIEYSEGLKISQGNEVLIPSSGETAYDIATASALTIKGVVLGGDINILRTENDVHFIAASIRGVRKLDIAKLAQGISVSHVYGSDIATLEFKIPTIPEQKKIARFLSAVDKKLTALEAQLVGWRDYKRGMMQALFSQTLRFKADDGSDFPEWKKKRIKNFAKVNPSTKKIPNTFKYIDLEAVKAGRLAGTKVYSNLDAPSRAQRVLKKGDILFQTVRPYQMNNLYFDNDGDYVASTGYTVLQSSLSQKYLYHFLHTHGFVNEVMKRCTGTSYPAISSSDLANIIVKLPSLREQQKIADALTAIDAKIEALTNRLEATREFKRGLLQKMFV